MSSLKDSQKKARLELTHNALDYLYQLDDSTKMFSRKDLFHNFITNDLITTAHRKESSNAKWQQKVLETLVARNLLERANTLSGQHMYNIADRERVAQILRDWDNAGLLIPALVFPSDFDFDALIGDASNKIVTQQARVDTSELESEEDDAVAAVVKELTKSYNNSIEVTNTCLTKIVEGVLGLRDVTQAEVKAIDELIEANSAQFGELEKKAGGANKRLDAVNRAITDLASAVRSATTSLKASVPSSVDSIDLKDIELVLAEQQKVYAAQQAASDAKVEALQKSVDELREQIAKSSSDQEIVEDLILRLDAHLDATEALQKLVTSTVTLHNLSNKEGNVRPPRTKAKVQKRVVKTSG
jgi:hypothetical protein